MLAQHEEMRCTFLDWYSTGAKQRKECSEIGIFGKWEYPKIGIFERRQHPKIGIFEKREHPEIGILIDRPFQCAILSIREGAVLC